MKKVFTNKGWGGVESIDTFFRAPNSRVGLVIAKKSYINLIELISLILYRFVIALIVELDHRIVHTS